MRACRAEIFQDIYLLKQQFNTNLTVTSGGFAPPHAGHINCIQAAANLNPDNKLIVVVNGDSWLQRKKGYVVMSAIERANIVASISGVDAVLIWNSESDTVEEVLEILQPSIFAKGGDRNSPENIPEYNICQKVGTQVIFGVGGDEKLNSSSNLIENILRAHNVR